MIFFTFPRLARDWCIAASPPPLARGSGDERWTWCGLGWGHGNGGISPQTRVRRNPSCTMATRQGKAQGKEERKGRAPLAAPLCDLLPRFNLPSLLLPKLPSPCSPPLLPPLIHCVCRQTHTHTLFSPSRSVCSEWREGKRGTRLLGTEVSRSK